MCVANLCCYGVNTLPTVNSQDCLQNTPPYEDQGGGGVPRLENGNVYLIPAYNFSCHGNVTLWGAYVERPWSGERYTIDFYVFRPSGSSLPNCYSLIGTNSLVDARPSDGRVTLDVPVVEQISVQPGDVVGVLPVPNVTDSGIVIDATINTVAAWHTPVRMLVANLGDCGYQVVVGGNLPSSVLSAPIITAVVGEWNH